MDKLSGSCHFLERQIPEIYDKDVLWQKLASPRKRRDASPTKTLRNRQEKNSNSLPVSSRGNTLEIKDTVRLNGNIGLHKDNDTVKLNEHEEVLYTQSFKETSV